VSKIKFPYRAIKAIDYSLWATAMIFAFIADWRIGCALLAYDLMRAFEELARPVDEVKRKKSFNEAFEDEVES